MNVLTFEVQSSVKISVLKPVVHLWIGPDFSNQTEVKNKQTDKSQIFWYRETSEVLTLLILLFWENRAYCTCTSRIT